MLRQYPGVTFVRTNLVLGVLFAAIFAGDSVGAVPDLDEEVVDAAEAPNMKKVANGVRIETPFRPAYLERLGVEGVNYFLDNNSEPYILCEVKGQNPCDPKYEVCEGIKKCYSKGRKYLRLGCMAVSDRSKNGSYVKGCWEHVDSIHKCNSNTCRSERRYASKVEALFCCCSTHKCNEEVIVPPRELKASTAPQSPPKVDAGMFSSDAWIAAIIFLVFVFGCLMLVLCYWTYREFKSSRIYKTKVQAVDSYAISAIGDVNTPLITCKSEDGWRNITGLEPVGRGRFGQVYRGMLDGVPLAVKVFPSTDVNSWIAEQEIYAIKTLRKSENILRFIGAEARKGSYWLLTDYMENGSLQEFLKCHILSLNDSLKIIATMLRGISFLHEEKIIDGEFKPCIVHRDFKSRNVLLKKDLTAVVGDFGLALKCENGLMPNDDNNHGQVGTRRYMSPEVLEGATEFTAFAFRQIDVYAAALVVWETLTRTALKKGDMVDRYKQPYEDEAGLQPSLQDLRKIVVGMKLRPKIRSEVVEHNVGGVLWKTVEDMWDMEADGRITSGCAYERANTLYLSYASSNDEQNFTIQTVYSACSQPASNCSSHLNEDLVAQPALLIKDGGTPGLNGFNATMDLYAHSCRVPPNVKYCVPNGTSTETLHENPLTLQLCFKQQQAYLTNASNELCEVMDER